MPDDKVICIKCRHCVCIEHEHKCAFNGLINTDYVTGATTYNMSSLSNPYWKNRDGECKDYEDYSKA